MAQKFVFKAAEAERVVSWTVRIAVPIGPGKVEDQEIVARYRLVPDDRMADVVKTNVLGLSGDLAQLKECLVGFEDLKDENGNSVPDEKSVPLMLSLPYAVRALARGYWEMVQGRLSKN